MTALKAASSLHFLHISSSSLRCKEICSAAISPLKFQATSVKVPKLQCSHLVEKLETGYGFKSLTFTNADLHFNRNKVNHPDPVLAAKFYAVMEAVADRVEMHRNIGEQRDNWNRLLLASLNTITLGAATMAGFAAAATTGTTFMALKLSSTLLYLAATGILVVMNKLQPSQLAEEQRNAARLFKQLHCQLQSKLAFENLNINEVEEAMEKVLALDRAYPLPLLGSMIEKFPTTVEPATWWPQQKPKHVRETPGMNIPENGWNTMLEDEMRGIVRVLKREDLQEYSRLSRKALLINKILAVSGPLLTLLGAYGSALMGSISGVWPVLLGVVAGSLAGVVNTIEHGGQVGMVFEMYRSNAGLFKLMEQTIESNLKTKNIRRRANGEVLEMKVALQLGRSISELKQMASLSSSGRGEFASKLF